MKTRTVIKALVLFFLLLFSADALAAGLGELRLSRLEGDVQIRTVDTGEWTPAVINFPLRDGDRLWVPEEGRAEVESRRGTVIRLAERSALDILTVDNDALQFYLSTGLAYVNAKGERGTTLQMDTPLSSIRVYERVKFSADVSDAGETDIAVFLGAVSVESRKGAAMVEAGDMLSLGEHYADLSPLSLPDAWEQWNKDQDRDLEERRESIRYLPEELAGYSSDFDHNGEWVDAPSYGHVWRPTVQVGVDWSPFRHGRWVWIGDDYVWIARESWGWAPYHYGRWSFVQSYGWCWVPPARHEVYWGPGYVGWVRTATYVAWVPLAPRETYYGQGYFGSNSVDIRHVDVNQVNIKVVYQNVHVRNSVTVVHNDTFIRGRQVDFRVKENPFLKERISVGRPRIEPERGSRIPSLREIPQAKAPPDRVRETRVEELRKRHRLVKEPDESVFSPETAPRQLTVEEKKEPKSRRPRNREDKRPGSGGHESRPPEPAPAPPVSRPEDKQGVRPEEEEKRPARDAGGGKDKHRPTPPRAPGIAPGQDAQPVPPAGSESRPPEPAPAPPVSRPEDKQGVRPEEEEKRPARDAGGGKDKHRPTPPRAPDVAPGRDAQPVPRAGSESRPPEPAPPVSRPEDKQRVQPGTEDPKSTREKSDRRDKQKITPSSAPAPAPRIDTRPTPIVREPRPAEQAAPTPPESRQRPRPAAEDKQSPRDKGDSGKNRSSRQPPVSKEETGTPPAVTKEKAKDERPTVTPDHKKKGKEEEPSETEVLPPEKTTE